jgi:hypothetical protein
MFQTKIYKNHSTIRLQSVISLQEIEKSLYKPPRSRYIADLVQKGLPENLAHKVYDSYFGGAS